jgi:hypothetical protein
MADARRVLGEAKSVSRNAATGRVVWIWSYAKVAPFSQCRSKSLAIAFDSDGKVAKVGRSGTR